MRRLTETGTCYAQLRNDAERLAGGLNDLAQRAAVYHHLFEHSAGNHAFPLIAAHGAMWASGYFRLGMRLGWWWSWRYAATPTQRRHRLRQLAAFADDFRDINRRVCVETYTTYHYTARFGDHPDAEALVPGALLDQLNRCHAARRSGRPLSTQQKRALFCAFFLYEQEAIVGPAVDAAAARFDWTSMKWLALRPLIRFSYFPFPVRLVFRDFASTQERIEKGFRAFDLAARVGWRRVEESMRDYRVLPDAFFAGSAEHFADLRHTVLSGA